MIGNTISFAVLLVSVRILWRHHFFRSDAVLLRLWPLAKLGPGGTPP